MTHILDVDADPVIIDGQEYRGDYYERTTKRVGSQQYVANAWAQGKVPEKQFSNKGTASGPTTKTNLVSSTRNFQGFHYPDGHGYLRHYSVTEGIRTRNLRIISNTQCYSRGFAFCSFPSQKHLPHSYLSLPLSHWQQVAKHDMYDITDVFVADTTDGDGYDRLVEVWSPDMDREVVYRANRDGIDDEPLSDREHDKAMQNLGLL